MRAGRAPSRGRQHRPLETRATGTTRHAAMAAVPGSRPTATRDPWRATRSIGNRTGEGNGNGNGHDVAAAQADASGTDAEPQRAGICRRRWQRDSGRLTAARALNSETLMSTVVLYIAGTGRSGSTVLANILGEVDGVFAAGEVRYLWQRASRKAGSAGAACPCASAQSGAGSWTRAGELDDPSARRRDRVDAPEHRKDSQPPGILAGSVVPRTRSRRAGALAAERGPRSAIVYAAIGLPSPDAASSSNSSKLPAYANVSPLRRGSTCTSCIWSATREVPRIRGRAENARATELPVAHGADRPGEERRCSGTSGTSPAVILFQGRPGSVPSSCATRTSSPIRRDGSRGSSRWLARRTPSCRSSNGHEAGRRRTTASPAIPTGSATDRSRCAATIAGGARWRRGPAAGQCNHVAAARALRLPPSATAAVKPEVGRDHLRPGAGRRGHNLTARTPRPPSPALGSHRGLLAPRRGGRAQPADPRPRRRIEVEVAANQSTTGRARDPRLSRRSSTVGHEHARPWSRHRARVRGAQRERSRRLRSFPAAGMTMSCGVS